MSMTLSPPELSPPELSPLNSRTPLKDYLIFRVDEADGHYELADHSALEGEAARYADLVADAEPGYGTHYEVRAALSTALLHTTEDTEHEDGQASWTRIAT